MTHTPRNEVERILGQIKAEQQAQAQAAVEPDGDTEATDRPSSSGFDGGVRVTPPAARREDYSGLSPLAARLIADLRRDQF